MNLLANGAVVAVWESANVLSAKPRSLALTATEAEVDVAGTWDVGGTDETDATTGKFWFGSEMMRRVMV